MIFQNIKWITALSERVSGCPLFEKTIRISKEIEEAEWNVTAIGIYNPFVNGTKVGNVLFAPGFTSFRNRLQYQKYDVTQMLRIGENTLGIQCANGWAVGFLGRGNTNHVFFDRISTAGVLNVRYTDGTGEIFGTDGSWRAVQNSVIESEFYHGETVDFSAPAKEFGKVEEVSAPDTVLIPDEGVPVREQERLSPRKLIVTPKGERVLDFGQNLAGYVEIRIKGHRGDRITLSHAEILDADGNFYTENLELAKCRNTYVLSGGNDVCKPSFSFQGYRYVRLDEYPFETVDLSAFSSVAIYSDLKRTGSFVCGNEKINRLYRNTVWGQRSNFIDIPTDCPQRDERVGWTGDAQVFVRTAAINYDIRKFMKKWLNDMMIEQHADGSVCSVVPDIPNRGTKTATAWGDASVICPWELYLSYGDETFLRDYFPMMERWVRYIRDQGPEEYLWLGGDHYGDWLAFDVPLSPDVRQGATQTDLIASAFYAHSVELLIAAGERLGKDVAEYRSLWQNIRKAFGKTFMKDGLPALYPHFDGLAQNRTVKGCTQTAIVLILQFKLYEDEKTRKKLIDRLVQMIDENGGYMQTGFLGTPYLLHVLTDHGYPGKAYDLFLEERCPSWLYSVNHGATTVWEHWDGIREDGSFWADSKNSFNHYAYGCVFDWVYGKALGIRVCPDGAGYRKIEIIPHPDRRLGFAKGEILTPCGKLSVEWKFEDEGIRYEVEIPVGTEARIFLPDGIGKQCQTGRYVFYSMPAIGSDLLNYDLSKDVRFFGRIYEHNGAYYMNWTASGFEFSFRGSGAKAIFLSDAIVKEFYAYLKVTVDGVPAKKIPLAGKIQIISLVSGLNAGCAHTVRVEMVSGNGKCAIAAITNLTLFDGSKISAPIAPDSMKMEIIGDSISVGYGVFGSFSQDWTSATEDGTVTYAALTARALGMEYYVTSASGRGIARNYDGSTSGRIPDVYTKVDAYHCNMQDWDFRSWIPDVIVINLGTNDANMINSELTATEFQSACAAFLATVREKNPHAYIIYAYGMMTTKYSGNIQEVISDMCKNGDEKICFLPMAKITDGERSICGHPSLQAHIDRAAVLIGKLKEIFENINIRIPVADLVAADRAVRTDDSLL